MLQKPQLDPAQAAYRAGQHLRITDLTGSKQHVYEVVVLQLVEVDEENNGCYDVYDPVNQAGTNERGVANPFSITAAWPLDLAVKQGRVSVEVLGTYNAMSFGRAE